MSATTAPAATAAPPEPAKAAKGAAQAKKPAPPAKPKAAKAPKAVKGPLTARARLYGGGISLAFGASFLVAGYEMVAGVDAFTACVWALFTFFAVGLVAWLVAITFGPALEDAAKARGKVYVQGMSEFPRHGVIQSHRGLMGGIDPGALAPAVVGGSASAPTTAAAGDFQDLASLLREGAEAGKRAG